MCKCVQLLVLQFGNCYEVLFYRYLLYCFYQLKIEATRFDHSAATLRNLHARILLYREIKLRFQYK